ncbi:MAG: hypothetical protein ABSB33_07735, partial [Tepidisphaeraceae bacterium]
MHLVVFTIAFFVCLDGLVWVRYHMLLRPLRRCRLWQGLLALAIVSSMAFAAALATGSSTVLRTHHLIPRWIPSTVFVWH